MRMHFDIVTPKGEIYDHVFFEGEDEEDCMEQVERYLDTKQGCSAEPVDVDCDLAGIKRINEYKDLFESMTTAEIREFLQNMQEQEYYGMATEALSQIGFSDTFFETCLPWWEKVNIP